MKKPQEKRYPLIIGILTILALIVLFAFSIFIITTKKAAGIPSLCDTIAGGIAFTAAWQGTKSNSLIRSLLMWGILFFSVARITQIMLL
jgi:hypothetical protein